VEHEPLSPDEHDLDLIPELVDAVAVIEPVGAVERVRVGPAPLVQAAAAAATGFIAGAATVAVLGRRREGRRVLGRPATRRLPARFALRRLPAQRPEVVPRDGAAQSFLVHVYALGRRP
jgi:hypothetical protein